MEISLVRISQRGLYTMRMHLANVVITGGRVAGQAHSLQDEVLGVSIDVVDLCLHSVRTKVLVKEKARIEVVATLCFGNDISGNNQRNSQSDCRHSSLCGRTCSGMVQRRSFQGFMRMLCGCVHS